MEAPTRANVTQGWGHPEQDRELVPKLHALPKHSFSFWEGSSLSIKLLKKKKKDPTSSQEKRVQLFLLGILDMPQSTPSLLSGLKFHYAPQRILYLGHMAVLTAPWLSHDVPVALLLVMFAPTWGIFRFLPHFYSFSRDHFKSPFLGSFWFTVHLILNVLNTCHLILFLIFFYVSYLYVINSQWMFSGLSKSSLGNSINSWTDSHKTEGAQSMFITGDSTRPRCLSLECGGDELMGRDWAQATRKFRV